MNHGPTRSRSPAGTPRSKVLLTTLVVLASLIGAAVLGIWVGGGFSR